jgi:hypothetical protein
MDRDPYTNEAGILIRWCSAILLSGSEDPQAVQAFVLA